MEIACVKLILMWVKSLNATLDETKGPTRRGRRKEGRKKGRGSKEDWFGLDFDITF